MSNLDSFLTNPTFYNPEHDEASRLLEQAVTTAATTSATTNSSTSVTPSLTGTHFVAPKGRPTPELHCLELGALPDPKYGSGTRAIEEKYLGFIEGWSVQGVKIHAAGIDIYVTHNRHWLRLKNFKLHAEDVHDLSRLEAHPSRDVHALDILNARVKDVRVTPVTNAMTASEKPTTTIFLQLGQREPVKLTGEIEATEWWHS